MAYIAPAGEEIGGEGRDDLIDPGAVSADIEGKVLSDVRLLETFECALKIAGILMEMAKRAVEQAAAVVIEPGRLQQHLRFGEARRVGCRFADLRQPEKRRRFESWDI